MTGLESPLSDDTDFQEIVIGTDFLNVVFQVEDSRWSSFMEQNSQLIAKAAATAYERGYEALTLDEDEDEDEGTPFLEVTVRLSNDSEIQELNRTFRNKNKPTNVLSFPMTFGSEEEMESLLMSLDDDEDSEPEGLHMPLGDIIIAYETCDRESQEINRSFLHHVTHLVVHGILHLLDYDHERGQEDAEVMESLEISILKGFDVPNPYLLNDD